MKLFLNSNVLMDYWFKREDGKTGDSFFLYIDEILRKSKEENFELFTSSFSIDHVKLETSKTKCSLELFNLIKDETISLYSFQIINVNKAHRDEATEFMKSFGLHETGYFEDFVNIAVALEIQADIFLSRDKELAELAQSLIKIVPPKKFIAEYLTRS